MYNHQEIKEKARMHINGNTNSKIVALIFTLLCGGAGASFGGSGGGSSSSSSSTSSLNDDEAAIIAGILLIVAGIVLFALLISAVFSAFVSLPTQVGVYGWFRRSVNDKNPTVGSVFNTFKGGYYLKTVGFAFLVNLYISLWSLLCLIPGMIKSYEYYMANFIKSENPELSTKRCLEMSKLMTDGHKADLFYLDLSFIGWSILGAFTCGILNIVYVTPYQFSAKAYAYEALKAEAITYGKLTKEDFVCFTGGYYPDEI